MLIDVAIAVIVVVVVRVHKRHSKLNQMAAADYLYRLLENKMRTSLYARFGVTFHLCTQEMHCGLFAAIQQKH